MLILPNYWDDKRSDLQICLRHDSVKTDRGSNNWWKQQKGEQTITANTVLPDKHDTLDVDVCK